MGSKKEQRNDDELVEVGPGVFSDEAEDHGTKSADEAEVTEDKEEDTAKL